MDRLLAAVHASLEEAGDIDPLQQFRAVGVGFLRWAIANPTHFQVISTRSVIDFETSPLPERHGALRERMATMLQQAQERGLLRSGSPHDYVITGRALVYGLARMFVDGQFPSWGLPETHALERSIMIFDGYIAAIST